MQNLLFPIEIAITPELRRDFIGNTIIVTIDDNRRIEIKFDTTSTHEHYDALFLRLTSKTHGVINTRVIKFSTVFNSMTDFTHPNKIGKHIWNYNGKYSWYGKPLAEDIEALQDLVNDYIAVWK